MKALLARLGAGITAYVRREPAMVTAVALALINTVWSVTADQVVALELIVENVLVLVAGKTIREQVTPVSKLPPSARG